MRILFLSRWYPYPPDNGSKIRVFNLLRGLCEQHAVSLVSFADSGDHVSDGVRPAHALEDIRICSYREFAPHSRRALIGYARATPRYLTDTHRPEMENLIRDTIRRARYDLVIASQTSMAAYHRSFCGIPAIFDEVELGLYRPDRAQAAGTWSALRRRLTWEKHRRYLARLVRNFRICTVTSESERRLLAEAAPGYRAVHVVPNCIDVDESNLASSRRIPKSLIFTGSFSYWPNYDAMVWFLAEIYPAIKAQIPDTRLTMTGDPGSRCPLTGPDVVQTGKIDNVQQAIADAAVSVVPVRAGGGTRLKILESLALRTPVVTTSKGVEGLELRSGEHLLIADTPRDFAQAVVRLLRDPEYARAIAQRGCAVIRSRYHQQVVLPHFMHLVNGAACPEVRKTPVFA